MGTFWNFQNQEFNQKNFKKWKATFTDFSDIYFEHLLFQLFLCRMGQEPHFFPSLNCYGSHQCAGFTGWVLHCTPHTYT